MPRVLVACEFSATVRDAFAGKGHDAWSCDLLPCDGNHIQADVLGILGDNWDLMIAHPPCTYLCSSGLHWNKRRPERAGQTARALDFVRQLLDAPIERLCIENPVGCIGSKIRKADQYIHPHQFGHDASKKTGLWLKGLPKLRPTRLVEPRIVDGKPRWANQQDSGQSNLPESKTRWMERAKTYAGIADAMAEQWSPCLTLLPGELL